MPTRREDVVSRSGTHARSSRYENGCTATLNYFHFGTKNEPCVINAGVGLLAGSYLLLAGFPLILLSHGPFTVAFVILCRLPGRIGHNAPSSL